MHEQVRLLAVRAELADAQADLARAEARLIQARQRLTDLRQPWRFAIFPALLVALAVATAVRIFGS